MKNDDPELDIPQWNIQELGDDPDLATPHWKIYKPGDGPELDSPQWNIHKLGDDFELDSPQWHIHKPVDDTERDMPLLEIRAREKGLLLKKSWWPGRREQIPVQFQSKLVSLEQIGKLALKLTIKLSFLPFQQLARQCREEVSC